MRNTIYSSLGFSIPLVFCTLFFMFIYWGAIVAIAFCILLFPAAIGITLMANALVKFKRRSAQKVFTLIVALLVCGVALGFQFYNTRPSLLYKSAVPYELRNHAKPLKGRVINVGFEDEIYLKMEVDNSFVDAFVQSQELEVFRNQMRLNFGPKPGWFPKEYKLNGYYIYYKRDMSTETLIILLASTNSDTCYYYRLLY